MYPLESITEVCPAGWHLPTVSDAENMWAILGDDTGIKLLNEVQSIPPWWPEALKDIDQSLLNSSGFSAQLGYFKSNYETSDEISFFWVQEYNEISGFIIQLADPYSFNVHFTDERDLSFPMRCVMD